MIAEMQKNPLLHVEILFDKTLSDVDEIQLGHTEASRMRRSKGKMSSWTAAGALAPLLRATCARLALLGAR